MKINNLNYPIFL